jgi:hypothetical protein
MDVFFNSWPVAVSVLTFVAVSSAWATKMYVMLSQVQKDIHALRHHRHDNDGSVVFHASA